jgi:hypothetical protein
VAEMEKNKEQIEVFQARQSKLMQIMQDPNVHDIIEISHEERQLRR